MSPQPPTTPRHLVSDNNPRISHPQAGAEPPHDRDPSQNHPDAPLPIQPYCDDSDDEPEAEDSLEVYEPRPITAEEDEDVRTAASRPRKAWVAKLRVFWLRNKGMALVLLAQMFGASMNVMTQILEIHSSMHPFQVFPLSRLLLFLE